MVILKMFMFLLYTCIMQKEYKPVQFLDIHHAVHIQCQIRICLFQMAEKQKHKLGQ